LAEVYQKDKSRKAEEGKERRSKSLEQASCGKDKSGKVGGEK
jgi:hypothetical protein